MNIVYVCESAHTVYVRQKAELRNDQGDGGKREASITGIYRKKVDLRQICTVAMTALVPNKTMQPSTGTIAKGCGVYSTIKCASRLWYTNEPDGGRVLTSCSSAGNCAAARRTEASVSIREDLIGLNVVEQCEQQQHVLYGIEGKHVGVLALLHRTGLTQSYILIINFKIYLRL